MPTDASAAEKIAGTLSVADALTVPGRPVKLEARLVRDELLSRAGLGGEPLEFFVGGKKVGTAMTGGDGRGILEYAPRMRGNLSLTVRVSESPRVKPTESTGTLFSWERRRPIVLVETAALMEPTTPPVLPLPSLSGKTLPLSPQPAADAADELKRLTDFYFNVIFVANQAGSKDADELRQWLGKHAFPPGPVRVVHDGEAGLTAMIEELRADGWDNVKTGIGRTIEFAEALVAQRMDVVIVPEPERGQVPRKAQIAKNWKEIRKKRL